MLLSIACLAGYSLLVLPTQQVEMQQLATEQAIQNAQIEHAITATSLGLTQEAATAAAAATMTPVALAEQDLIPLTPRAEPLSEWEGIPVMPGALATEARDSRYSFTILATPAEIQAFYNAELARLGWQPLATSPGSNGPAVLLYTKDSATVSVAIIPVDGSVLQVVLVK